MNITIARSGTPWASLTRAQIAGRFSLLEHSPLAIVAERGLTVRVHTGHLWMAQAHDGHYREVRAGERFAVQRDGQLVMRAGTRSELEIEWPAPDTERLFPGLEPLTLNI